MDNDTQNKSTKHPIEELIDAIEEQRTTSGGIILDGKQTDLLLGWLTQLLTVMRQQQVLINKLNELLMRPV